MGNFIQLILEPMEQVYLQFFRFLPNLLAMLIILIIGIMAARLVRAVIVRLLITVRFDSWSDRMGFTTLMRKGDLWSKPSGWAGAVVFWVLIIVAVMSSLSALKIRAIDNLVSQFVLYLPRALSGVIILVSGHLLSGFMSRAVLIAAVNRGYPFAKLLAESVRVLIIVLIIAMTLEQLHVAPSIVIAAFSIIFGGIVLGLAIAFGVGGIDAARSMIAKQQAAVQDETKDDIKHI